MKMRETGVRHAAGMGGALALAIVATASGMQQGKALTKRGVELQSMAHGERIFPNRFMLLGADGTPTTDWVDVPQKGQLPTKGAPAHQRDPLAGLGADCASATWIFDAGEFDPLTGNPVGADDCGATPDQRFLVAPGYQMPTTVADFIVQPGTEGAIVSRVALGWEWSVTGTPSSEDCYILIALYDDFDETCGLLPNGLPHDYLMGAVVLFFEDLEDSAGAYYSVDLNICSDFGVDAMFRTPLDGEGAALVVLANAFDGTFASLTPATGAQPMLWGTEPGRAGTNALVEEYQDDFPPDGQFNVDECYGVGILDGAGAACPGNAWDADAVCTMLSFGTLDAGNVIPPGVDFLEESLIAPSSASFGTGLPQVPAGFFGPGSDPFFGNVTLEGDTLDPGCGTVDTIIFRPESAVIPSPGGGAGNVSQDIPIELVAMNLVSASPIVVTFNGGQNPQQWDVRVELADPQPANVGGIVDTDGGGTFNLPFIVTPTFVFTRVSDQMEVIYEPGAAVVGTFNGSWTAAPPTATPLGTDSNGFFITSAQFAGTGLTIRLTNAVQTNIAPNNDCASALPIAAGLTPFDTTCATTDGPTNPAGFCLDFSSTQTSQDIWYTYTAPATGCEDCMLLVTTCDSLGGNADYDTDLAMYLGGICRPDTMLQVACNDDAAMYPCGRDALLSAMYVPVTAAQEYLIRVGGFGAGDAGTGTLHVLQVPIADGFIDQQPDGVTGYASDNDTSPVQRMSEDFRLKTPPLGGAGNEIQRVRIWGSYIGGDEAPINSFTVMIQSDAGGVPGPLVHFEGILAANTTHTDVTPPGPLSTVWQIDLDLDVPVNLPAGRYWISVFNNTAGDTDTFYWNTGAIDLEHAYELGSLVTQGGSILPIPADDLALSLEQGVPCPSDTNDDNTVNVTDLLALLAAWGPCDAPCPPYCTGDVNSDCVVNVTDLLQLLADWGACD